MIVDAHNDLLHDLWRRADEPRPFADHWLPRLRAGRVGVQVCAISSEERLFPGPHITQLLHQAAAFHRLCRENPRDVAAVRTAADLDRALKSDQLGAILSLEGVDGLGQSIEIAEVFVELGVRMVGLTWQFRNAAADGNAEPSHGGLSRFGRRLVSRLVELGVILDVAHASERTFDDVLEIVTAGNGSVVCSHGGCRALLDLPRNVSDAQLRALSKAGGMMCVAAVPALLSSDDAAIERMVEHVLHALEVAGEQHVAIGSDFMAPVASSGPGSASAPAVPSGLQIPANAMQPLEGLAGPQDFGALAVALRSAGLSPAQVDGVLGENMVRFLRRVLP